MPDPRLELAIDLANQFNARLIGIGAEHFRTAYYGDDVIAGYYIAADMETVEADLNRAEEKFRLAAAAVQQGCDWRASRQFPLEAVTAEARAADLIVTSRSEWARGTDYKVALPGVLTLQAGCPVLVAPADTGHLKVANVVVAWKDSREARRAVADSLPSCSGPKLSTSSRFAAVGTLRAPRPRVSQMSPITYFVAVLNLPLMWKSRRKVQPPLINCSISPNENTLTLSSRVPTATAVSENGCSAASRKPCSHKLRGPSFQSLNNPANGYR